MRFLLSLFLFIFITVGISFSQVTGLAGWNIFLDPGHSQRENMGIYNYSEAEKNLGVALALREMLLKTTDIDTVYISRTNDQQIVSLSQRTDYANSVGAAWFHSIHSDAGSPEYNSTLLLWGQYYNKAEKVPNGGKAMADIIVNILTRGMRTNTRGSIGDCTFYAYTGACSPSWPGPYLHVNRQSNMPSELSEAGFHTNPRQNQLNMNAEWKKLEAKTFYWSILQFHDIPRPAEHIVAGILTNNETGVPINGARVTISGKSYVTDSYASLFFKYTNDPELLHNGFYFFDALPYGTQEMIVEADGYYSDTLTVTPVDTFFTFKDVKLISKVPPYIVSTTPANGATNVPAWNDIVFNFSRKMNRAMVEVGFSIEPSATGKFIWQNDDKKMTFRPDSLRFLSDYAITISGTATDFYGHQFDGNQDGVGGDEFVLHFKTGPPDMSPPKIATVYPKSGASDIELLPIINLTYDEAIDSNSIAADRIRLERFQDHTDVPGTLRHYLVNDRSVFCFFPAQKLFADEVYVTRVAAGFFDAWGNTVTAAKSYSFRTATVDYSIIPIDNLEVNLLANWWAPQQSGSTAGILTEKTSRDVNNKIVNLLSPSTASLQVNYGWDLNAGSWLIRLYIADSAPAKTVLFNKDYILQTYVFGDGSGNQFRFCVDDNYPNLAAANHEVSPWLTIDWIGWKLVSWDMSKDSTGTWLGDGNLDGTLRLESLQFTYNPGSPTVGTLYFDDLRIVKKVPVPVEIAPIELPQQYVLQQNHPNPFNAQTIIEYQISSGPQPVRLEIFDILGKRVRTLVNESQNGGFYQVRWDGKDDHGRDVASGIYLYKLIAGTFNESKRLLLLR
ncbi:MAG: Ig-like domain-containing protein [candidate division KSB1 bacterium]|nr:Ig-like domain-containing protein [candidate division KSB1 bacterium]